MADPRLFCRERRAKQRKMKRTVSAANGFSANAGTRYDASAAPPQEGFAEAYGRKVRGRPREGRACELFRALMAILLLAVPAAADQHGRG